jgi:hypothetical protein
MHIAMSVVLTLMFWPEFRFLRGNFMGIGYVWLLIAAIVVLLVISAVVVDAALLPNNPYRLNPRADWPIDVSESTATESPSQANLNGSSTTT